MLGNIAGVTEVICRAAAIIHSELLVAIMPVE
jgi:hypothetical protein